MCLYKRFSHVLAYLILKPNCPFCMGYSLCIVAIFGHFQNALIFRILAVFGAVFCIEQLECVCTNVFGIFNFEAKLPILHGLYIAFALWPFLAIFKMLSFFEY